MLTITGPAVLKLFTAPVDLIAMSFALTSIVPWPAVHFPILGSSNPALWVDRFPFSFLRLLSLFTFYFSFQHRHLVRFPSFLSFLLYLVGSPLFAVICSLICHEDRGPKHEVSAYRLNGVFERLFLMYLDAYLLPGLSFCRFQP